MHTLLQINVTANSGSHGKIAEDIGRLALERGWRSVIAYGQRANPSQSELLRIGNSLNLYEHAFETRLLDNHGLASRKATRQFLKKVDDIRPDIVHLQNIHGYYLNYKLLFQYLKDKGIPVIWTLHDCWPFTGHCAYFDYAECDKWMTECHAPCPCKGNYPGSFFIDKSAINYRKKKDIFTQMENLTLVPVSDWLGGLVKQSFLRNYRMKVIHNGIDIQLFKPAKDKGFREKYKIGNKKVVLGVANIWEERKGMRDFLKLRESLPDDYIFVLVGAPGDKKEVEYPGVIRIGRTQNQQELVQLYSLADIFLNLTFEDNYPTTNLEAMACGTPVLTYNTGGSPEAVSPETGWVVEKGNIEKVAAIIKDYLSKNEVEKVNMGKACRERAIQEFDKNKRFNDYFELYARYVK